MVHDGVGACCVASPAQRHLFALPISISSHTPDNQPPTSLGLNVLAYRSQANNSQSFTRFMVPNNRILGGRAPRGKTGLSCSRVLGSPFLALSSFLALDFVQNLKSMDVLGDLWFEPEAPEINNQRSVRVLQVGFVDVLVCVAVRVCV